MSKSEKSRSLIEAIGRRQTLTTNEEIQLAALHAEGKEAEKRLHEEENRLSRSDKESLRELVSLGEESSRVLIERNMSLVEEVAEGFRNRGLANDDVVQDGILGLAGAIGTFEQKKRVRFATYARPKVIRAIEEGISNANGGLDTERYIEPLPFSEVANESEVDGVLDDFVVHEGHESLFEVASRQMLPEKIAELLAPLDPHEREILKLRFGLDHWGPRTLAEVGEHFNLSGERIRQIEAEATKKLRQGVEDSGV